MAFTGPASYKSTLFFKQNVHQILMCVPYCLMVLAERELTIVSNDSSGLPSLRNPCFKTDTQPGKESCEEDEFP